MSHDAIVIIRDTFSQVWRLFTEWRIPGTYASPGMFLLFSLLLVSAIRALRLFFGEVGIRQ